MSRLAGNVPGADHITTLSQEAAANSPNISDNESRCGTSSGPRLAYLTLVHLTGCSSVEIMSSIMVQQGDRLFSLR